MPEPITKSQTRSQSASRAARVVALKKRLAREFLDGKSIAQVYSDNATAIESAGCQTLIRDGLLMVMRQWANEEAARIVRLQNQQKPVGKSAGRPAGGVPNANV